MSAEPAVFIYIACCWDDAMAGSAASSDHLHPGPTPRWDSLLEPRVLDGGPSTPVPMPWVHSTLQLWRAAVPRHIGLRDSSGSGLASDSSSGVEGGRLMKQTAGVVLAMDWSWSLSDLV